jgi:hypothetical protein
MMGASDSRARCVSVTAGSGDAVRERGLIVDDHVHGVRAGDVPLGHDAGDVRIAKRFGSVDREDLGVRVGTANDGDVEHAGEGEVVDVPRLTPNLVDRVRSRNARADQRRSLLHP